MFVPITREDFINTGRSFHTDAIVREVTRLLPVATDDIALLSTRGYTMRMLEELKQLRVRLQSERDDQRVRRNEAKRPYHKETAVVRQALLALRSGAAMVTCAIATRRAPEGETPEAAREATVALMEHVDSLVTPCGDPSRLRMRLAALRWLLTLQELSAGATDIKARAEFVEQLDILSRRLPAVAGLRSRAYAPSEFDEMDEVDGRAYFNLQLLTRAGKVIFEETGHADHASLYEFRAVHEV
jgi:hypothetical protein